MPIEPQPHPPEPRRELAVDDNLVPEGARWELLNGRRIMAPPADEPHGSQHAQLAWTLQAHTAPGWKVALDMLTRTGEDTDIAPDASILPIARDPITGGRQLEALAFEIVSHQGPGVAAEKARALLRRGVRRVFMLRLLKKKRHLSEFDPTTDGWRLLDPNTLLDDEVFATPLPIRALFDAAEADAAVARALLAREHPLLMEPIERAHAWAEAEHERAEAEHERAEAAEARREAERERAEQAEQETQRAHQGQLDALRLLATHLLGRPLTPHEDDALRHHHARLGAPDATRALLQRQPAQLAAWLAHPGEQAP